MALKKKSSVFFTPTANSPQKIFGCDDLRIRFGSKLWLGNREFLENRNNLPETNSSPLKMDGWNTSFLLGRPIFRGYVSFREGNNHVCRFLKNPLSSMTFERKVCSYWAMVVFFSLPPNWKILHPGKLTCPLKRDYFNRKYIFQPSFFQGMC